MNRLNSLTVLSLALLSVSALAVDPATSKSKKHTHRAPYTAPSPFASKDRLASKSDTSTNPYLNPSSAQPYANKPNTYLNPAPAYKISSSSGRRLETEPTATTPAPFKPYENTAPPPAPAVNNYDASSLYNNPITVRHTTKRKK